MRQTVLPLLMTCLLIHGSACQSVSYDLYEKQLQPKSVGAPVENPKSEKLGSMIEDISSVPLYILNFWIRFWGGYTITLPHSS